MSTETLVPLWERLALFSEARFIVILFILIEYCISSSS